MNRPSKAAKLLLALVVCSAIFADYWEYSRQYHGNPESWMDVIQGTADAPQQYRIAVPEMADLLRRHGHMGLRHGFTLIDFAGAMVAVYLLFAVFERSSTYRAANETTRWFGVAAFVFLVQFYFAWITWYQRPETMASAATVAATLWLLTLRLPLPGAMARAVAAIAMVLISALQAFVRADLIFVVHLAVLLVCLTPIGGGFVLPRWVQAATSGLSVVVAGGVQYYLMHVAYPMATYGKTPVVELKLNMTNPLEWPPFVLFLVPYAWLMRSLLRGRRVPEAPAAGVVLGSVLYLCIWIVVGRIEEVRIFMPFAVALVPMTCICAMQRVVGNGDAARV